MIVLGIDPGLATTGWGVVEASGSKVVCVEYGCILTPANEDHADRLKQIHNELIELIDTYNPDYIGVEELFFYKNVKTATKVGEARGVMLLTASIKGVPISEYTPLQVKQAVVAYGRAEKIQVQKMVAMILALPEIPKPDDAADALAVAITCAQSVKSPL